MKLQRIDKRYFHDTFALQLPSWLNIGLPPEVAHHWFMRPKRRETILVAPSSVRETIWKSLVRPELCRNLTTWCLQIRFDWAGKQTDTQMLIRRPCLSNVSLLTAQQPLKLFTLFPSKPDGKPFIRSSASVTTMGDGDGWVQRWMLIFWLDLWDMESLEGGVGLVGFDQHIRNLCLILSTHLSLYFVFWTLYTDSCDFVLSEDRKWNLLMETATVYQKALHDSALSLWGGRNYVHYFAKICALHNQHTRIWDQMNIWFIFTVCF